MRKQSIIKTRQELDRWLKSFRQFLKHGQITTEWYCWRHGRVLSNQRLTKSDEDELALILSHSRELFKTRECYMNASKLAQLSHKLTYCEGFATSILPISHAWVEFKGRPIDVTWRQNGDDRPARNVQRLLRRIRHNLNSNAYYGIDYDDMTIALKHLETKEFCSMVEIRTRELARRARRRFPTGLTMGRKSAILR